MIMHMLVLRYFPGKPRTEIISCFQLLIMLFCLARFSVAAPEEIKVQAGYLRAILAQADEAYFNRADPIMGNEAYDELRRRYEQLIADYPELAGEGGVGAVDPRNTVLHQKPVLSLKKAYTDEEVAAFIDTCGTRQYFCIEPKIDGLTIVLHYQNGVLVRALTRGDGEKGQDVTRAALAAGCIPTVLAEQPRELRVRGELFLTRAAFEKLNNRRAAQGQPRLKSARNSAAGTLRLADYAEISRRGLSLRIFEWIEGDGRPETHQKALERLRAFGLPTIESVAVPADQVPGEITRLNGRRSQWPYETDGIVIKVNDLDRYEELGATTHHPRGALARKYKHPPKLTKLLRIEWSQGETGKWTPIAHFEPVEMNGATVRSATLHNENHLRALDLRIGDWIQVIRAGGSVPEIIGVCTDRRTGKEKPVPEN
ncbi:hypothetical protein EGM51_08015 [Verrucomicrobia bacterium S94]|nr:hypothetical protein EGM51_08015 [Verrucomicrobia bacterium S94]